MLVEVVMMTFLFIAGEMDIQQGTKVVLSTGCVILLFIPFLHAMK